MDKLEMIRTEYMTLKVLDNPECRMDVLKYLKIEARAVGATYRDICGSIEDDKFDQRRIGLMNKVFAFLGLEEDDTSYLDRDIEVLEQYGVSVSTYEFLYRRLIAVITDDNWYDIYRLAELMGNKVVKTDNYYDRVRSAIDVSRQGVLCVAGGEDDTDVFREFFDEELGNILSKGRQKVKVGEGYDKRRNDRKN